MNRLTGGITMVTHMHESSMLFAREPEIPFKRDTPSFAQIACHAVGDVSWFSTVNRQRDALH